MTFGIAFFVALPDQAIITCLVDSVWIDKSDVISESPQYLELVTKKTKRKK